MSDAPFSEQRSHQGGGPFDSQAYNTWIQDNFKDLVYLYNRTNQLSVDVDSTGSAFYKQVLSMSNQLDRLEDRLEAIEEGQDSIVFNLYDQIDNDRFNNTPFAIPEISRNKFHAMYNFLTLPQVVESSVSKIRFINEDGTFNVANGLEIVVEPDNTSADSTAAVIETSSVFDAINNKPGRVWERNVISNVVDGDGAICSLFIRIPNELSVTGNSNGILLTPYPVFDVDILEISYSIDPNVALNSASVWTPLNEYDFYASNPEAVGNVPPGAWVGDTILNSGTKGFYFGPRPITAFRIKLRQNVNLPQGIKYVYSYGLSSLDIRYDKFSKEGKTMIQFNAPDGDTISSIDSVIPDIWNVQQAAIDEVFSYRVIWETAFNSGSYTLTPVALSQRVWLEVTLKQLDSGYTPAVSSISINYT